MSTAGAHVVWPRHSRLNVRWRPQRCAPFTVFPVEDLGQTVERSVLQHAPERRRGMLATRTMTGDAGKAKHRRRARCCLLELNIDFHLLLLLPSPRTHDTFAGRLKNCTNRPTRAQQKVKAQSAMLSPELFKIPAQSLPTLLAPQPPDRSLLSALGGV